MDRAMRIFHIEDTERKAIMLLTCMRGGGDAKVYVDTLEIFSIDGLQLPQHNGESALQERKLRHRDMKSGQVEPAGVRSVGDQGRVFVEEVQ
jgi:hypothetical protein